MDTTSKRNFTTASKFISLLLRHRPEAAGLELDDQGHVEVSRLLSTLGAAGHRIDRAELDQLVETNDKKRFAFDPSGERIRAVQGHSRSVDPAYDPARPPDTLFHGTVEKFLAPIRAGGLKPRGRQFVHLSLDRQTAVTVAMRRGKPMVLEIMAAQMHTDGCLFYRADNGVWLVSDVPMRFIRD
ncbi:MAG: RNA 2'-phosphotransferase [Pseudomonadota bacterium]